MKVSLCRIPIKDTTVPPSAWKDLPGRNLTYSAGKKVEIETIPCPVVRARAASLYDDYVGLDPEDKRWIAIGMVLSPSESEAPRPRGLTTDYVWLRTL